jgi:hypothetical protein
VRENTSPPPQQEGSLAGNSPQVGALGPSFLRLFSFRTVDLVSSVLPTRFGENRFCRFVGNASNPTSPVKSGSFLPAVLGNSLCPDLKLPYALLSVLSSALRLPLGPLSPCLPTETPHGLCLSSTQEGTDTETPLSLSVHVTECTCILKHQLLVRSCSWYMASACFGLCSWLLMHHFTVLMTAFVLSCMLR